MQRIRTFIKSQSGLSLFFIFLCGLLSYAIYIPWLGIYGDDWQYFYVYHLLGAGEYGNFVLADRPFSAWVYWLFTPMFGEHYAGYQILLFFLRIGTAYAFWWVVQLVWKNHPRQCLWLAILFAIYPTFLQQPLPLEYVLHFTIFILFLVSLGWMIFSIRYPHKYWFYTIPALFFSAGMFSIEYFVGMEFARPFLIWKLLKERDGKVKWTEVLKGWAPYAILLTGFYYWRIFIYSFQKYQPVLLNDLNDKPLKTIIEMVWRVFQDLVTVLFRVWSLAFNTIDSFPAIFLQAAIILLGSALVFWLLRVLFKKSPENAHPGSQGWGIQAVIAGLILLLTAGIPFWITGIPLWLQFPWDRTSLPFIPGACLVVVGLVDIIIDVKFRNVVLAGLVGLSFGIHYLNNINYIQEWQTAKDLMWQLTWRAPVIKPGTVLLTDGIPLLYYGDNTLSPAINWTYAPELHQAQIPYRLFDLNIRQDTPEFANLGRGLKINHLYRSFDFRGSTDQLLVVSLKEGSCLRIYGEGQTVAAGTSDRLKDALYLSNLSLIEPAVSGQAKPPSVTGEEPAHGWCYYFEKADLARQTGDWEQVVRLADEVAGLNLQSKDGSEYMPYIEGYGRSDLWDKAKSFSESALQDELNKPQICGLWQRLAHESTMGEPEQSEITKIIDQLKCQAGG